MAADSFSGEFNWGQTTVFYRVMPYHSRLERALKKEAKYYLWDWAEVEDEEARFENMIASHRQTVS